MGRDDGGDMRREDGQWGGDMGRDDGQWGGDMGHEEGDMERGHREGV